jgi:hypothetical protein
MTANRVTKLKLMKASKKVEIISIRLQSLGIKHPDILARANV